MTTLSWTFLLFFYLSIEKLTADCICKCVDRKNVPICTSKLDIPPICPPKICSIPPPSIPPIPSISLPPIGTTKHYQAQVYDEETEKYEWEDLYE